MRTSSYPTPTRRRRLQVWVSAALGIGALIGCDPSSQEDSNVGGGAAACGSFTACGGDLEGTWELEKLCLDVDPAMFGAIDNPACSDFVQDVRVMADGMLTVTSDTLTFSGTLDMDIDFRFSDACLQASAGDTTIKTNAQLCSSLQDGLEEGAQEPDAAITSATCSAGAAACNCTASAPPQTISSSGAYSVTGNTLMDPDGETSEYCVQGDSLTLRGEMMTMGQTVQMNFRRR